MIFEWEIITRHEDRAKVFGGWIVRTVWTRDNDDGDSVSVSSSLVFIPDTNHEWSIEEVH